MILLQGVDLHPVFCYGDEQSDRHACMNGHCATANQLIELAKRVLSLLQILKEDKNE